MFLMTNSAGFSKVSVIERMIAVVKRKIVNLDTSTISKCKEVLDKIMREITKKEVQNVYSWTAKEWVY